MIQFRYIHHSLEAINSHPSLFLSHSLIVRSLHQVAFAKICHAFGNLPPIVSTHPLCLIPVFLPLSRKETVSYHLRVLRSLYKFVC